MNINDNSLNTLISEIILYHSKIGLAICRPCKVACSKNFERHLRRFHKSLTLNERRTILEYIELLPNRQSIEEVNSSYSSTREMDMIEGLPVVSGFKCHKCAFFGLKSTMINHCQKQHRWTANQSNIKVF